MPTAKLIIKDEVNVKIEGLSVATRRELNKKFKYEIPGARFIPAVRLGRWDGCETFFQLGGSTYINLLPEILPILEQQGYDIDLEDLRQYPIEYPLEPVSVDYLSDHGWPEGHPLAGEPIVLRDYQLAAVNEFLTHPQSIQCIATGAGKCLGGDTVISINVDKTTPFGKFLINKLLQEQENDVTKNTNRL
jgi:hypothetical protein